MDTPDRIRDFSAKYGLTYLQLRDPGGRLHESFSRTEVIPRTILLDAQHNIALLELGYTEAKLQRLVRAVRSLLGEPPQPSEALPEPATVPPAKRATGYVVESMETVDSKGSVGYFTSIDLDRDGRVWISYRDYTLQCLKVAHWTGSAWQIEVVDTKGDAGWSSSIRVDPGGRAGVSYFAGEMGKGELRYAYASGEGWKVQTVDTGDVGSFTSLAFDAGGRPHISYFDVSKADLKFVSLTWGALSSRPPDPPAAPQE